ncbi:hypothetical protein NZK33_04415 [Cyanobium sp. FGCU-6]|nr:hypothetical protein [Cyanobium sp. FGCU6]
MHTVLELHAGTDRPRQGQREEKQGNRSDGLRLGGERWTHGEGALGWDDGTGFTTDRMYTDWTAVILLLLTAAPLAVVVATTVFFIARKPKKPQR